MTKANENAKVVLVIPCFNQAEYLSECLDSVLAQAYRDWVCMVVDDGSSDDTRQVAEGYTAADERMRYFWQQNRGLGAARNSGVRHTISEYILPLDADDRLHPAYLEKTVTAIADRPEVKVVYTGCRFFGALDTDMQIRKYSYQQLLKGNIFPATALYRRSDYESTPGYNEAMLYQGWEDWDFWLSLLGPDDKVYQVDETLFYYRRKAESMITCLEDESKRRELRRQIFLSHREVYNKHFEDPINLYYRIRFLEQELKDERQRDIPARILRRLKRFFSKP